MEQKSRAELASMQLEAAIEDLLAARAARELAGRGRWLRRPIRRRLKAARKTGGVPAAQRPALTYVVVSCGLLATASGCVQAVEWGTKTIGVVPVAMIGTFVLGCILTAAMMHARSPGSTPPAPDTTGSTGAAGG